MISYNIGIHTKLLRNYFVFMRNGRCNGSTISSISATVLHFLRPLSCFQGYYLGRPINLAPRSHDIRLKRKINACNFLFTNNVWSNDWINESIVEEIFTGSEEIVEVEIMNFDFLLSFFLSRRWYTKAVYLRSYRYSDKVPPPGTWLHSHISDPGSLLLSEIAFPFIFTRVSHLCASTSSLPLRVTDTLFPLSESWSLCVKYSSIKDDRFIVLIVIYDICRKEI